MDNPATLNVIEGDYGLVSLDVACIQSILYARLHKIPIQLNPLSNIKNYLLYTIPSLRNGSATINTFPNIANYVNKHSNEGTDLSPKQNSESLAFINFVMMKLKPILDFLYWVDQRNCDEFTSRWFISSLPFPFNYSYTKQKKAEAVAMIETLYPNEEDLEVIKDYITKSATQTLATIATRLGKAKYFFGESPTMVDVVVYAHIAPLLKLPLPTNDIPALLVMWPNLTDFIKGIDAKYFPEVKREVKYLKSDENNKQNNDEDVSYMAIFILVVSASSLVLGFAMKRGLFASRWR